MICPRCQVEMVDGFCIGAATSNGIVPKEYDQPKIVSCLKCPKCGHSDDGLYSRPASKMIDRQGRKDIQSSLGYSRIGRNNV